MTSHERGSAPSPTFYDVEFENIYVYWREEGIGPSEARILALYQYAGGNAFGLLDLDGRVHYAPRPVA